MSDRQEQFSFVREPMQNDCGKAEYICCDNDLLGWVIVGVDEQKIEKQNDLELIEGLLAFVDPTPAGIFLEQVPSKYGLTPTIPATMLSMMR